MARAGIAGALAGLGEGLMRRADVRREDELMARQDARQDALLDRQEKREDLRFERQQAIEEAREEREAQRRSQERGEDREFQRGLAREQMAHQSELAGEERELMTRRLDREDRRAIEEQATEQLTALDARIQDLQDMLLKSEVLGTEGEVERQIAEAEEQKLSIRSRLVDRLYEMGDPRYKDMPADQRLYAAGYSKDQVARFMRLAQGEGGGEEEAAAEEPPAGRSDTEIASDVQATDPTRVAKYGLSDADRAALGLDQGLSPPGEDAPAMTLPESPPPLRDMSQAGRGRRLLSPEPGGGAPSPGARRRREAPEPPRGEVTKLRELLFGDDGRRSAPAKADPKKVAEGVRQSLDALLKQYDGDVEKAPGPVRVVIEALQAQLRDLEKS